MQIKLLFFLLGLFIVRPGLTQSPAGQPDAIEVGLGGVYIQMDMQAVLALKGEPESVEDVFDVFSTIYTYDDLRIYADNETVVGLYTEDKSVCTPQGLCPQDTFDKAVDLLGEPVLIGDGDTITYVFMTSLGCGYHITTRKKNDRRQVMTIELPCYSSG